MKIRWCSIIKKIRLNIQDTVISEISGFESSFIFMYEESTELSLLYLGQ